MNMIKVKPVFKAVPAILTILLLSFVPGKNEVLKAKKAEAVITGTDQTTMPVNGTILFTERKNGQVKMELKITVPNKAGQTVAVHFHEHGDCGDAGNNAHGHWNPTNAKHGQWGSAEFHSGDIGNVKLNGKGKGKITITSNRWSIGGDEKTNILNRAVIVHGGVDDYTTQPTGNSGPRIGCGVISMKN